jgi:hypothetical protein
MVELTRVRKVKVTTTIPLHIKKALEKKGIPISSILIKGYHAFIEDDGKLKKLTSDNKELRRRLNVLAGNLDSTNKMYFELEKKFNDLKQLFDKGDDE